MVLRVEDIKQNLWIIVRDNRSEEVQTVVHLNDTKIGTSSNSKNLEVTGDFKVAGNLKANGTLRGSLNSVPLLSSGRLTLTSGTPVTTIDVSSASLAYFTPYNGSQLTVWDGSSWRITYFEEKTVSLSAIVSGSNCDVFGFHLNGTIALELGDAWTSNTIRSSDISLFQGVMCKTQDPTRRYLGTIRTNSTGMAEDSISKRFVWNYFNQVPRILRVIETTDSWSYVTAAWRRVQAVATNRFEYVCGDPTTFLRSTSQNIALSLGATVAAAGGIGIDSTTTNSAQIFGGEDIPSKVSQIQASYQGYPGVGYHSVNWLEYGGANISFIGDLGIPLAYQAGMYGEIMG